MNLGYKNHLGLKKNFLFDKEEQKRKKMELPNQKVDDVPLSRYFEAHA